MNDELLIELIKTVNKDKKFTHGFKDFTFQAVIVIKLCDSYEGTTGKIITIENINNVLEFINDISPIMNKINQFKLPEEKIIKSIIKDFYIPCKDELKNIINEDLK